MTDVTFPTMGRRWTAGLAVCLVGSPFLVRDRKWTKGAYSTPKLG